jgi:RNA polymerase sigma-H factor
VNLPDTILVRRAKEGDVDAMGELVVRYRRYACSIANRFYFAGSDRDDVDQEALIAITVAVHSFRESEGVPFTPFLGLCIHRWLTSALVASRRQKHQLLNEADRHAPDGEGDTFTLAELVPDRRSDPVVVALARERLREIAERFQHLTAVEREAIVGVTNGRSYLEIDARPGGKKRTDNAVQRARKKLAA